MLPVKDCVIKLNELRRKQNKVRSSELPYMAEYLAHLQRLEHAYEKEYLRAVEREVTNEVD